MKYQLHTRYVGSPSDIPARSFSHSELLAEFASRLDDHEVYGNVQFWAITPEDDGIPITTLTVETDKRTTVTLHDDEDAALKALREGYDPEHEYPDDDFVQSLIDQQGLVIYIETHNYQKGQA